MHYPLIQLGCALPCHMHTHVRWRRLPHACMSPPPQKRQSWLALRSVYVLCADIHCSCDGGDCPTRASHPFNTMGRTLGKQSLTEYCALWSPSHLFGRARCTERLHEKGSCSTDIFLLPPVTHQLARTTPATCPHTHAVMPAMCRTSTLGLVRQCA